MKQETAVELFEAHLIEYGFDLSLHKIEIEKFKQIEKEQKGYSEEEVKYIVSEALESALVTVDLEQWFKQFKKK